MTFLNSSAGYRDSTREKLLAIIDRVATELAAAKSDEAVCEAFERTFRAVCPTGGGQICFNIGPASGTGAMVSAYPWEMSDGFDVDGVNLAEIIEKLARKNEEQGNV